MLEGGGRGRRARLGLRHVPRDERCARGSIFLTAGHGHRRKAQQNTDNNDAETEKEEQRERRGKQGEQEEHGRAAGRARAHNPICSRN